jgi:hypothetical protein
MRSWQSDGDIPEDLRDAAVLKELGLVKELMRSATSAEGSDPATEASE